MPTRPRRSSRTALPTPNPGSVVGTLHSLEGIRSAASLRRPPVDYFEIRLDCLPWSLKAKDLTGLARPLLLTPRSTQEGGQRAWSDQRRLAHLEKFLDVADLVDWELQAAPAAPTIASYLSERGILWVASMHDFSGTPSMAALEKARHTALALGAKVFKVATTLRTMADLVTLATLQESRHSLPVATMGMGPLGRMSRLLCASLGSVLNYGWMDQPQIMGQFPARMLKRLLRQVGSASR